MSLKI